MTVRWITQSILIVALVSSWNVRAAVALEAGVSQQRAIAASASASFTIEARHGEFITAAVDAPASAHITVTLLAPHAPARHFDGPSHAEIDVQFVVAEAGEHRLEIANVGTGETVVHVMIEARITAEAANGDVPEERRAGKRIEMLRESIARDGTSAVAAFWNAVEREGTPLIEPDGDHSFVTFLWRGTPAANRVQLFWPVRTELRELEMTRIQDTDVWYKTVRLPNGTRLSYRIAPGIPRVPGKSRDRRAILAVAQADPLNPRRWPERTGASLFDVSSILELDAAQQPWMELSKGVSAPRIESHTIASRILGNERSLSVVVPADPAAGEPYALAVVFDEDAYLERIPAPVIVANLIAAGRIPRTLIVLVGNPTRESRARELPPNRDFADFLAKELVPWIRERWPVTNDPGRVVVAGSSYGGLAATFAAMTYPETFGNVLSQSGSFWWATHDGAPAEPNVFARWFAASPRKPIRFYLSAGTFEKGLSGEQGGILEQNRHLRDVLIARGYDIHYQEVPGGHDHLSWRGTFAGGLAVLLGDSHAACPFGVAREVAVSGSEQQTIVSAADPTLLYRLSISIPETAPPADGFPVIYLLDGNAAFGTMVEAVRQLGGPNSPQRAVVVGIASASEKRYDSAARLRDYTPPAPDGSGGGADALLDLLERQVKPLVAQRVKIDRNRQTLFGHSLGGVFVLHALFTKPESFQTYVAASPSIWWGDRAILEEERRFATRTVVWPSGASLLVTVGEYEQKVDLSRPGAAERAEVLRVRRMVDASRDLISRLQATAPQARIAHVEFAGETHGSVVAAAISRAVHFALGDAR